MSVIYRVEQKKSCIHEFPALLLPTYLGQPIIPDRTSFTRLSRNHIASVVDRKAFFTCCLADVSEIASDINQLSRPAWSAGCCKSWMAVLHHHHNLSPMEGGPLCHLILILPCHAPSSHSIPFFTLSPLLIFSSASSLPLPSFHLAHRCCWWLLAISPSNSRLFLPATSSAWGVSLIFYCS